MCADGRRVGVTDSRNSSYRLLRASCAPAGAECFMFNAPRLGPLRCSLNRGDNRGLERESTVIGVAQTVMARPPDSQPRALHCSVVPWV